MLGPLFPLLFALSPVMAAVSWNMTLENHSPLITYAPYSDGTADGGWALWTSDVGFLPKDAGGKSATGDIFHVSSFPGASFSFQFRGTALTLYGHSNATYSVSLDNDSKPSPFELPSGILYETTGLPLRDHYVTVTLVEAGHTLQMDFQRAIFTASSPEELTTTEYYGTQRTDVVKFAGSWKPVPLQDVPSPANPIPYSETNVYKSNVSMTFSGARAVSANANLNWGHTNYIADLNGVQNTYNASTYWLVGDTVMFFQDNLDPTQEYTLTLIHAMSGPDYKFTFSSFKVWKPIDAAEHSKYVYFLHPD
ncbi:hypothetical protein EXIGLDRAFT_127314 [Exidia glandulosa HHB12029]|uniref:Uncharacterized protein n=1 Tax=Exidia glandulosa HHB12029 TaxID=1314781 RepID=A0A165GA95_EXIGL|nr:hypothetical protein EXIGLDRAFT_127314 [Exidia glandulosa HHB12029]